MLENREELQQLVSLGKSIKQFRDLSQSEQTAVIDSLFDFECFAQAIILLKFRIQHLEKELDQNKQRTNHADLLACFQKLAYANLVGLENEIGFLDTLKWCLVVLKPNFETLRFHLVEMIAGAENYLFQVKVYRELAANLEDKSVRLNCLERLALILEKKLFLEKEVEPVYNEIIQLDKHNIKACRFYRIYHSHLLNWNEAAEMLERLLVGFPFPHEKQRTAHELAQVYLYQLSDAEKAEKILKEHCEHSFLDARQTWIDCLEKQSRIEDLSQFLTKCANEEPNPILSSQLIHRKALYLMRSGSDALVEKTLLEALSKDPKNFEAYESLAVFLAERKQLKNLANALKELALQLTSDGGKNAIQLIVERLEKIQAH